MRILTLNIWGVPYAKHRMARFRLIAQKILELAPDVVCLQEVYLPRSPSVMIEALREQYPYSHHFASAVVGSGLLTLSKYPIVDAAFHKFRMSGKPFRRGDIFAGKGIGLTRLQTPHGMVDVYNTHTHAQYDSLNDNQDAVYTNTNLYEAMRFISANSTDNLLILCGDLNTRPDQLGYQIITQIGGLTDAYHMQHQQHPITYAEDNPYTAEFNSCLDYVMIKNATVKSIDLCMTESPQGQALAYSDHYGLIAELDFEQTEATVNSACDSEHTLQSLMKDVQLALIEAESEQLHHYEQAVLGFSTLVDGNLLANFVRRYIKPLGKLLRWIVNVGGLAYGLYSLLQALLNLQPRKATLQSIHDELQHQIKNKRLFDGREW